MSASKFTAGPWWAVVADRSSYHARFLVLDSERALVAECVGEQLSPKAISIRGAEANAQLCAAAPDLYAALSAMLAWVEQATCAGVLDAGEMQDNVECAEARSALAKVRGEG